MKIMTKGYRFTISYVLLSIAVILAFIRIEIIANEAIVVSCQAAEEAKETVRIVVNALAETSDNPSDPELLARRDNILERIERNDC